MKAIATSGVLQSLARCSVALMVAVFAVLSVGELAVDAMNAPTILPHSQAHVMGYMCKGGGRGPAARDPNSADGSEDSRYRIADTTRPGFSFNQDDPTVGILEYLNLTDCQLSARLLNRRGSKVRYICVPIRG